jgi:hypothetical protein
MHSIQWIISRSRAVSRSTRSTRGDFADGIRVPFVFLADVLTNVQARPWYSRGEFATGS